MSDTPLNVADFIIPTQKTYRRACLADFFDDEHKQEYQNTNNTYNKNYSQNDYIVTKNQQEFGHRKRIKPWRTGTKSQQQIVPKGFKKGFRG